MNLPLNIDLQQIFLHLFNFTILAGGLYFLLYKPVKDFMEKRTAYYQGLEDAAVQKLEDAKKVEKEYQERLDNVGEEIKKKLAKASKDAEEVANTTIADAKKQKEKILLEARELAQREKEKAVVEAKEEIVKLALAATKKMLGNEEGSCE